MSVETRPRSTRDGARGEPRAGRPYRGYGAYTAGSTALRLDYAGDLAEAGLNETDLNETDFNEVDNEADMAGRPDVTRTGVRVGGPTSTRTRATKPRPARIPRPRRRTPWISDVTPVPATDAPPLPVSLPKTRFLLLMTALVVAGVVGVLVLHTKINEGAFRLSDLRATQASLDQQEQQLEQQLADLSSPGNLRAAATRLGLIPAGDPAYIYLPDGRVVGVPQPAGGTGP